MLNDESGAGERELAGNLGAVLVIRADGGFQRGPAEVDGDVGNIADPVERPLDVLIQTLVQRRGLHFVLDADQPLAFFRRGWTTLRWRGRILGQCQEKQKNQQTENPDSAHCFYPSVKNISAAGTTLS